jgi:hypothetical protein
VTEYKTRKPTGIPSWPILLLAGVEKSGKSYACAEASASDLIGRTLWIGVGEDQPDELGAIPGARFEIVEHDGSYRSILGAVTWATQQDPVEGKPNLIVLDSAGRVWTLLSDMAQETANERARRKNKGVGEDGADITMDLWNVAKQRWAHILDELRHHQGPVIVTARLDEVTLVEDGKPVKDDHGKIIRQWKVQAEKNLPFEVGAIVQLRAFGEAYLTGVRSLRFRPKPNEYTRLDEFTVDQLWRNLGLADGPVGDRHHDGARVLGQNAERIDLLNQVKAAAAAAGVDPATVAAEWAESHNGQNIGEATDLGGLEVLRDDLTARATRRSGPEEAPAGDSPPSSQTAPEPSGPESQLPIEDPA